MFCETICVVERMVFYGNKEVTVLPAVKKSFHTCVALQQGDGEAEGEEQAKDDEKGDEGE